jgi:ATP-binding cassette subfamily B protein
MAAPSYLQTSRYPLFRLLNYMRGSRGDYLLATLYSVLNKLFDIFPEILIGGAVAVVVNRHDSWLAKLTGHPDMLTQLFILGAMTFVAWGLESWFQYLYSLKWRNLAQVVENKLRMETYQHIQGANLHRIESVPTGQLTATINDDVNQLERFLEDGINQIIQIFASTILVGAVFLVCSPLITVFAILPIPFILLGAFYFQHRLQPRFLKVRKKAADISSALANNLQGLMTIKSYTAEAFETQHIAKLSDDYQQANAETIRISAMVTPVIRIIVLMGFLCTLLIGGYQTINGDMNVGVFSLLVFLSQRLLWPFNNLAEVTVNFQRVMASTKRALDLLTWPQEKHHQTNTLAPTESGAGDIVFDQIDFSYPKSKNAVFQQLNLTIPAKQTVAFVGETGSGKSSLIKLLCRFYQPSQGNIRYGNTPITDFEQHWWRQQIALVSQDIYLFCGSIRENIAYANLNATDQAIQQAAQQAGIDDYIQTLPEGYMTCVGERGLSLSGGQRQRIAIARAILKNAPILILDEATSAVDNETEQAIQQALNVVTRHKTTIVIAHRLSTVRHADAIYVLDKGQIIEHGTHDQLVAKNGRYAKLWQIQTGEHP